MKKLLHTLALVLVALGAQAQTAFPLFQPSDGIMVGDENTYVTTSATGADVTALFSGTCTATTFLLGDASCATGTQVTALLDVFTDLLDGLVPASGGGTTHFLRADGTWVVPAGGVTGLANPTASLGLTAVNGVATTAMRSDAAPALSQSIAPTWTETHTFTNSTLPADFASTDVNVQLRDTDAGADEKIYWLRNSAGIFQLQTRTDAAGVGSSAITVDRTGTTIDSLALTGTAITLNGVASSDFARRSQLNSFTASANFTAGGAPINLAASIPAVIWEDIDDAALNRRWTAYTNAETFNIAAIADVSGAGTDFLSVSRTNTTIDSIALNAGSVSNTGFYQSTATDQVFTSSTGGTSSNYAMAILGGAGAAARNIAIFGHAGVSNGLTVTSNGSAITVNVAGTLQVNGVAVPSQESGSMTPALTTGCTTTPAVNFRWTRVGNMVTIAQTNTPTCTSNSVTTAITGGPIPASIRPGIAQCVAYIAATDNGAGTVAAVQIDTSGNINWGEGAGASCSALGWTASGTKTLNPWTGSYVLN